MSPSHLRIVLPPEPPERAEQLSLAFGDENALWLAALADLTASDFLERLRLAKPRWVIDLRPVPDFLKPGFNRGTLFRELTSLRACYADLGGVIGRERLANPHIVAEFLMDLFREKGQPFGPAVLLLDRNAAALDAARMLHRILEPTAKGKWHLRVLGRPIVDPHGR